MTGRDGDLTETPLEMKPVTEPYFVQDKPWRKVVSSSHIHEGRGSILGPDTSRRTRWYVLALECGHEVERVVKYEPIGKRRGGTTQRKLSDVKLPPKKVRCDYCEDIK